MKGFMIYETPLWGDEENAVYLQEVKDASYTLKQVGSDDITCYLEGTATNEPITKATCNKDDTYDFGMGALIALMKKCGLEKSAKAYAEIFDDTAYGDALIERDKLNRLLRYAKDDINKKLEYIKEKDEEIKKLKISNETLKKDNEAFRKTCEKLKEENKELHKNIDELFESEQHSKTELGRLYFEKRRLEEKVEKLKLDCEKLRHGYLDSDNLEEENKKLKKRINELENYNNQLEKRMEKLQHEYDLCRNSENALKITTQLQNKSIEKLTKAIDGYKNDLYKVAKRCRELEAKEAILNKQEETINKRDEMWEKIFELHKESDVIIKVKKEDVNTFLHELENKIPEITWVSGDKIFETKYTIGDIYKELETCDTIYFRLWKINRLSYTPDLLVYAGRNLEHITYLPPMRWDLFRKGRIYVKLDAKHFDEFKQACIKELGISPNTGYFNGEMIVINIPKEERFVITRDLKGFKARKIINWEDVR